MKIQSKTPWEILSKTPWEKVLVYSYMTANQNNFYTITIYEVQPDASIEWCFTNLDNNTSNNKISIYSCLEIKNSQGL